MAAPFGEKKKKIGIWDWDAFKKDFEWVGTELPSQRVWMFT